MIDNINKQEISLVYKILAYIAKLTIFFSFSTIKYPNFSSSVLPPFLHHHLLNSYHVPGSLLDGVDATVNNGLDPTLEAFIIMKIYLGIRVVAWSNRRINY